MNQINNNPFRKRLDKDKYLESFLTAIKHFKRPSNSVLVKVAKRLEIAPRLLKREIEKLDCFL
tara:strand:- start:381 stop:569 length:189 start_codon:yes stop_codon:yes gene_type:complete